MWAQLADRDADGGSRKNTRAGGGYAPPSVAHTTTLHSLLAVHGNFRTPPAQQNLFGFSAEEDPAKSILDHRIFYAGELSIIARPSVSIVGTRKASPEGAARARKLARGMAEAKVSVVSGLAYGIDTQALTAAIEHGGRTVGVIGTPLDKASPAQNARLQEKIYSEHLLISQFEVGENVYPSNFPKRNKLMAAISDGTIVVEASDTSGTLHQSAECIRLGRWLFILRSVAEDASLTWPAKFLKYDKCVVVDTIDDVTKRISQ